jgi:hypothetical protein
LFGAAVSMRVCGATASTCSTYRTTTTSTGLAAFSFTPRENSTLTFSYTGTGRYLSTSRSDGMSVSAKVTGALSATRVPAGTTVSMKGTVAPVRYKGFVYLQRYTGGAWRNVTYRTQSTTGAVSIPVKMPRGTYSYRLYVGRTANAEPGWSPTRVLTVY